jgi:protein-S-isoprenylcysteine O-methyltransferase Ste14
MTCVAPVTFIGLFALLIWLLLRLDAAIGVQIPLPGPWHAIIGVVLIIPGSIGEVWAFIAFRLAHGTPVPFNPPPTLVTTGPFAYVRNPMIIGIALQLTGAGLWLRSWSIVLLLVPAFCLFFGWALRAIEEPELERRLGDEYRAYKARVPMFIPRWRR